MSDINILNHALAEMMLVALISAALFYLIFLYHCIKAYLQAHKHNMKIRHTVSYGYVMSGVVLFGLQLLFIFGFTIDVKNRTIQNIVSGTFMMLLFLSPIIIVLFGYYYNRLKNKDYR